MERQTKGHWPRGRLRNTTDPAEAARLLKALARLVGRKRTPPGPGTPPARRVGFAPCARRVGVDQRTLRRWLARVDCPPDDALPRLRAELRRLADL